MTLRGVMPQNLQIRINAKNRTAKWSGGSVAGGRGAGGAVAEPASRRAARLARPSWFDTRLLLGLLLVLVAVVVGARVFASADRSARLFVAAHPLVPGEHLQPGDLSVGRVQLHGVAGQYVSADGGSPPVGYVVQRYVGAGELLPARALAPKAPTAAADRLVALPVAPGHLPPDLGPGTLVDVYTSVKASGGQAAPPTLVARGLPVQQRSGGTSTLSGSSTLTVVVAVPAMTVADVVRAVESGAIDLVAEPTSPAGAPAPSAVAAQRNAIP